MREHVEEMNIVAHVLGFTFYFDLTNGHLIGVVDGFRSKTRIHRSCTHVSDIAVECRRHSPTLFEYENSKFDEEKCCNRRFICALRLVV